MRTLRGRMGVAGLVFSFAVATGLEAQDPASMQHQQQMEQMQRMQEHARQLTEAMHQMTTVQERAHRLEQQILHEMEQDRMRRDLDMHAAERLRQEERLREMARSMNAGAEEMHRAMEQLRNMLEQSGASIDGDVDREVERLRNHWELMVGEMEEGVRLLERRYSGSLSYSAGSYVFAERTHSAWLTNGLTVAAGNFTASASIPVIVQNSGVVSVVAGQPVPTGGSGHAAVGGRAGDGTIGTRRRPGDMGMGGVGDATPTDSALIEFRDAYAVEVGDPYVRVAYDVFKGRGVVRSLSVSGSAKAPLRDLESGVGRGAWDFGAGASIAVGLGATWLFVDGARWWFGDLPDLELRDATSYSVGVSRPVGGGATSVLLGLSGSSRIVPTADAPLSASVGVSRFLESGRSLSLGLGVGLSESSPGVSAYLAWSLPLRGSKS